MRTVHFIDEATGLEIPSPLQGCPLAWLGACLTVDGRTSDRSDAEIARDGLGRCGVLSLGVRSGPVEFTVTIASFPGYSRVLVREDRGVDVRWTWLTGGLRRPVVAGRSRVLA